MAGSSTGRKVTDIEQKIANYIFRNMNKQLFTNPQFVESLRLKPFFEFLNYVDYDRFAQLKSRYMLEMRWNALASLCSDK